MDNFLQLSKQQKDDIKKLWNYNTWFEKPLLSLFILSSKSCRNSNVQNKALQQASVKQNQPQFKIANPTWIYICYHEARKMSLPFCRVDRSLFLLPFSWQSCYPRNKAFSYVALGVQLSLTKACRFWTFTLPDDSVVYNFKRLWAIWST